MQGLWGELLASSSVLETLLMKEIVTITLSDEKPTQASNDEYTAGDQATIFLNEDDGKFGYHYHGVRLDGSDYQSRDFTGFESRQAAMRDAVLNYVSTGLGC
jgi:hypothetical protein